jgi:hypothetical protein
MIRTPTVTERLSVSLCVFVRRFSELTGLPNQRLAATDWSSNSSVRSQSIAVVLIGVVAIQQIMARWVRDEERLVQQVATRLGNRNCAALSLARVSTGFRSC